MKSIIVAAIVASSAMSAANASSPHVNVRMKSATSHRQDAKKDGPVSYKSAWKIEVPANTKSICVGDTTGDGTPRLLSLDDKGAVTVHKVAGEAAASEAKIDLGAGVKSFIVGAFATGKSDVIVAPGIVAYRDGAEYKTKKTPEINDITGVARFVDGDTVVFLFDGGQPTS